MHDNWVPSEAAGPEASLGASCLGVLCACARLCLCRCLQVSRPGPQLQGGPAPSGPYSVSSSVIKTSPRPETPLPSAPLSLCPAGGSAGQGRAQACLTGPLPHPVGLQACGPGARILSKQLELPPRFLVSSFRDGQDGADQARLGKGGRGEHELTGVAEPGETIGEETPA